MNFALNDIQMIEGVTGSGGWWDKVPSKFARWGEHEFRQSGFRAVPSAIVQHSAYIAPSVLLMPLYVPLESRVRRTLPQIVPAKSKAQSSPLSIAV